MRQVLLLALALFTSAAPAVAEPEDVANDLIVLSTLQGPQFAQMCLGDAAVTKVTLGPCNAYILGAVDALQLSGMICVETGGYTIQTIAIVRNFIRDHPENWGKHPISMVRDALISHFPCSA